MIANLDALIADHNTITHTDRGMIEPDGLRLIAEGIELAVQQDGERIVEIGAYRGNTTAFMARCLRNLPTDKHKLFAIDAFDARTDCEQYESASRKTVDMALRRWNVDGLVTVIALPSQKAWQYLESGFVFVVIDGSHQYEDVLFDIQKYGAMLANGGYLWLDDLKQPYYGVMQAADELLKDSLGWHFIGKTKQSILVQKAA